jgi:hypothetical protein
MTTKKSVSKPDDLIESKVKGGDIELTEHDLGHVSGGFKIDGVDGESSDDKHKGEIQLESYSFSTSKPTKK